MAELIDRKEIFFTYSKKDKEEYGGDFAGGVLFALDKIDEMPIVNEWISVKDRLPEETRYVLAWKAETEAFAFAMYFAEIGVWTDPGENVIGVSHWMPLPEPPKGE